MIKRYSIRFESVKNEERRKAPFISSRGYQFYGALMDALRDEDYGGELHAQELTPVSQYVTSAGGKGEWLVSLMGEAAIERLSGCLDALESLRLPDMEVFIAEKKAETVLSVREIVDRAAYLDGDRFVISFRSPASFKSGGEYAMFPTSALIVKSLIAKWNAVWTESVIADDDAAAALTRGLRLTSYKLCSSYYTVKGAKIPGFTGEATLSARLPAPLLELWKPLLFFGSFSGMGIKCALGMGGITASPYGNDK